MYKKRSKSGYTLLFSVLTAALVLGVSAFILGVARKQYILSSTARDSKYAFYAADAGLECVALNEIKKFSIGGVSPDWVIIQPEDLSGINEVNQLEFYCGDASGNPTRTFDGDNGNGPYKKISIPSEYSDIDIADNQFYQLSFSIPFTQPGGPTGNLIGCALINIYQFKVTNDTTWRVVQSRGYNLCKEVSGEYVPDDESPRTVERALRWTTR